MKEINKFLISFSNLKMILYVKLGVVENSDNVKL